MRLIISNFYSVLIASDFHHPSTFSLLGFNEISSVKSDIVVLNGDTFDPLSPPQRSVLEKWFSIIANLAPRVILLPGNHDYWLNDTRELLEKYNIEYSDEVLIKDEYLVVHGGEIDELEKEGYVKDRSKFSGFRAALDIIRKRKKHNGWLIVGHTHLLAIDPVHKYATSGTYHVQTPFFRKHGAIPGYGYILISRKGIALRRTNVPSILKYAERICRKRRELTP